MTIDGGQAVVPNQSRREKRLAFVQVAACMLKVQDLRDMRDNPMMNPRQLDQEDRGVLVPSRCSAAVRRKVPRISVRKFTIRILIDAILTQTSLYDTFKFLVYRESDVAYNIPDEEKPAMDCWACGEPFQLPRHAIEHAVSRVFARVSAGLCDYLRPVGADCRYIVGGGKCEQLARRARDPTLFHLSRYLLVSHLSPRRSLSKMVPSYSGHSSHAWWSRYRASLSTFERTNGPSSSWELRRRATSWTISKSSRTGYPNLEIFFSRVFSSWLRRSTGRRCRLIIEIA